MFFYQLAQYHLSANKLDKNQEKIIWTRVPGIKCNCKVYQGKEFFSDRKIETIVNFLCYDCHLCHYHKKYILILNLMLKQIVETLVTLTKESTLIDPLAVDTSSLQ